MSLFPERTSAYRSASGTCAAVRRDCTGDDRSQREEAAAGHLGGLPGFPFPWTRLTGAFSNYHLLWTGPVWVRLQQIGPKVTVSLLS